MFIKDLPWQSLPDFIFLPLGSRGLNRTGWLQASKKSATMGRCSGDDAFIPQLPSALLWPVSLALIGNGFVRGVQSAIGQVPGDQDSCNSVVRI